MAHQLMDRKIIHHTLDLMASVRMAFVRTTVRRAAILLTAASLFLLASCREDMQNQPKFIPLRENQFYADGRSARPQVEGTIARGQLQDDPLLYTGKVNGQEADQFPFAIT